MGWKCTGHVFTQLLPEGPGFLVGTLYQEMRDEGGPIYHLGSHWSKVDLLGGSDAEKN